MSVCNDQLCGWAKPPSDTEEDKCRNAVSAITDLVKNKFGSPVEVFLQGSYRNRTNVKKDSDVDIVVLNTDYFFPNLQFLTESEKVIYNKNRSYSVYTFAQYKNEIQELLSNHFGGYNVERKNKCIRVQGNSYRVHADVVPCFVSKRLKDSYGAVSAEGIEFVCDDNSSHHINSFPKQHHDNGASKNQDTYHKYKGVVRVLKNVRNNIYLPSTEMSSFFLECLVWNVPDWIFLSGKSQKEIVIDVISRIWSDMANDKVANKYVEVSNLKWLFIGAPNDRTPEKAKNFMELTLNYIK